MVNKSKIIILSIFIFSLAFFLSFTVLPKNSLACHLDGPYTYYRDYQCTQLVNAYDFLIDAGGCVMGYAAGQLYNSYCSEEGECYCLSVEAKWYTSPSYDRQVCKKRWGPDCGKANIGGWKEGYWDSLDSKCVVCSGPVETEYFDCSGDYNGDYKCESACGANSTCDEISPQGVSSDGKVYCDNDCNPYVCNANSECNTKPSGSRYDYFCVYDWSQVNNPQWKWILPPFNNEDGNPWQECFDGYDNDCDGDKDCADYWCKGVQNPNTGVICCQNDSDCPKYNSTNHLQMYCDTNTHTCKTIQSCSSNDQCEGGWCCDKDPKIPSGCQGSGSCVAKGTLMCNNQYICDPPEGFVSSSNENANNQASKKLTLIDLLINPFSYFFKR